MPKMVLTVSASQLVLASRRLQTCENVHTDRAAVVQLTVCLAGGETVGFSKP